MAEPNRPLINKAEGIGAPPLAPSLVADLYAELTAADTPSSRIPDTTMDADLKAIRARLLAVVNADWTPYIKAFRVYSNTTVSAEPHLQIKEGEASATDLDLLRHDIHVILSRLEARERELAEARKEKTDGYIKSMRERERVNELVANYETELTDVRSQNAEMMRVVEAMRLIIAQADAATVRAKLGTDEPHTRENVRAIAAILRRDPASICPQCGERPRAWKAWEDVEGVEHLDRWKWCHECYGNANAVRASRPTETAPTQEAE